MCAGYQLDQPQQLAGSLMSMVTQLIRLFLFLFFTVVITVIVVVDVVFLVACCCFFNLVVVDLFEL